MAEAEAAGPPPSVQVALRIGSRAAHARGVLYPRWLWPAFATPGMLWLALFFLLPLYVVLAIAFGTLDPVFRSPIPVWNPLNWDPVAVPVHLRPSRRRRRLLRTADAAHVRVRRRRLADRTRRRLSGGVLRRAIRGSSPRAVPRPAARAVLRQLHDAHARVGQPPRGGRTRQPHVRHLRGHARRVAVGPADHRRSRPRLRIHPLHDPAALCGARPYRQQPARGGARPRRGALLDVSTGHAADEPARRFSPVC